MAWDPTAIETTQWGFSADGRWHEAVMVEGGIYDVWSWGSQDSSRREVPGSYDRASTETLRLIRARTPPPQP